MGRRGEERKLLFSHHFEETRAKRSAARAVSGLLVVHAAPFALLKGSKIGRASDSHGVRNYGSGVEQLDRIRRRPDAGDQQAATGVVSSVEERAVVELDRSMPRIHGPDNAAHAVAP